MGNEESGELSQRRPGKRARWRLRGWHRWLGVLASGPVVVIALTGVLLNHGPGLGLDLQTVESDWLFTWYGLSPREPMRAFRIDPAVGQPEAFWLVEWGGQVLYQGQSPGRIGRALAAGRMGEEVLVAGEEGLLLLDAEGKLMEQIHHSLLPPGHLQRCGVREGILICETSEGIYQLRQWPRGEPAGPEGVRWFDLAAEPPPEVREAAARAYRGEGLPLSRVVLDLHSGRMFGTLGVVLYDLAALVFLALVGTGLFLALRNRR